MKIGDVYLFQGGEESLFEEPTMGIIIRRESFADVSHWYMLKFSNGESLYLREEELQYHGSLVTKEET